MMEELGTGAGGIGGDVGGNVRSGNPNAFLYRESKKSYGQAWLEKMARLSRQSEKNICFARLLTQQCTNDVPYRAPNSSAVFHVVLHVAGRAKCANMCQI